MQTLRNKLIALTAVGVLAVIGSTMNSSHATTQASASNGQPVAPVNIVSPIPLPVTGSATVTGTVAATQSGSWNFGITGNSATNPILVRDVDNATGQPVAFDLFDTFTVPANKRLIIEYVSWRGSVNQGFISAQGLSLTTSGFTVTHIIPGSQVSGENIGGAKVWFVADPGTTVLLQSSGPSIGDAPVVVSGYYVNVP